MRQRHGVSSSSSSSKPSSSGEATDTPSGDKEIKTNVMVQPKRSPVGWWIFFVVIMYSSWAVYDYQYESLPAPLTAERAGKRGFSEVEALKHVQALTELGPHPVGSDSLDLALKYVLAESEKIKKTAHWEVDVEVDYFRAASGANNLNSGLFKGKTLAYSDLSHIVLRILPKYSSEAREDAILVSSHIDTVFSTEGAGDCSSCVAVMLELARGLSQWAHGFKNAVIFLFNTGEEEGLSGAHSFIDQHPWNSTIRLAIDLEAMGIGGKSAVFQAGPHPWAIENFALVAKYPSGQIISQDIFSSGAIKSATDFQIYRDVAGLSGLDFAYVDRSAVYHTKNDKLELLKPGSLQHLGENMLGFLLQTAASSSIPGRNADKGKEETGLDPAIYFDILGTYMVVYRQSFANMLHTSMILQSLLIWATSLLMGGYPAIVSLALSFLSVLLMWICSLGFSLLVAFFLPLLTSSPVPYIGHPWLVVGLFGAPAFLGALCGQHFGYIILQTYLLKVYSKRKQLSPIIQADCAKLEAERWLYKGGSVQWLILLIVGSYYKIGSTFLALVWLLPPTFTYGLLEATLSPMRLPRPLKLATLLIGLAAPILLSSGFFIRLAGTLIAILVRFDRNPGSTPEWLGNLIIAAFISATICLTLVYLLSYVHLSGAKKIVVLGSFLVFGFTLFLVLSGEIPPFTEDTARAVNVVHVVDARGQFGDTHVPSSYISLFSITPGRLTTEINQIKEGFVCGRDKVFDFVTFSIKYGCWSYDDTEEGWSKSEVPTLHVDSDITGDDRITAVSIDTKDATRWSLAINMKEIQDFTLRGNSEELVFLSEKSSIEGWHVIQFAGGKNAPRKFELSLYWVKNSTRSARRIEGEEEVLLKLRTDVNRMTPKVESIMAKLPSWCSLFGKSTSPYTLAFLTNLPVNF